MNDVEDIESRHLLTNADICWQMFNKGSLILHQILSVMTCKHLLQSQTWQVKTTGLPN